MYIEKKKDFPKGVRLQELDEYVMQKELEEKQNDIRFKSFERREEEDLQEYCFLDSNIQGIYKELNYSNKKDPFDKFDHYKDVFQIKYVKNITYHELQLASDRDSKSIFDMMKAEIIYGKAKLQNIEYLKEKSQAYNEFYFIFNHYLLVRVITVPASSSEREDQFDKLKSFNNETRDLTKSTFEQQTNPKAKKDRMVKSHIAICYYFGDSDEETSEMIGDTKFFTSEIRSIVEKFSLERISKFLRKMGAMRTDSFLARDFLYSEERKDYNFNIPVLNDRVNFLYLLTSNLHQSMSEVIGSLDPKMVDWDSPILSGRRVLCSEEEAEAVRK